MRIPRRQRMKIPLRHPAEANPVPVVADGLMSTAMMAEGRNIPVLILDTSERPDIDTMIQVHYEFGSGDVTSAWSFKERLRLSTPRLILSMSNPSQCLVIVDFDMTKGHGMLVDQILWAQGFYLQAGRPGDRLAATLDNPRIIVEVPKNETFKREFQSVYEKAIFRRFRDMGMSRADSKQSVQQFLKQWRGAFRQHIRFRRQEA